jgi:hypothetical protein
LKRLTPIYVSARSPLTNQKCSTQGLELHVDHAGGHAHGGQDAEDDCQFEEGLEEGHVERG